MNAFIVELADQPGEMARVADLLAQHQINILVHGLAGQQGGYMGFLAGDEEKTRKALDEAGIQFMETPAVAVRMIDQPGQAASVSKQLASAGINIRFWLPVDTSRDTFTVAVGVSDVDGARHAIAAQLSDWSYT